MASKTITKREAVRRAIAAGKDMPKDGVPFIKEQFGIDVSSHAFSLNKGAIKKQQARWRRQNQERNGAVVASGQSSGNSASLARRLKPLVDEYGVDAVREVLDVIEVFAD